MRKLTLRRSLMNIKRFFKLASGLAGLWLIVGLWPAIGQQAPPTENKGVKSDSLTSIDLGPEIDGMQGRQLRLRLVTIEPGGMVRLHSHKDRPTVVHLLQGTLTVHPEGGASIEHKEGESWSEGKETTEWAENKGTKPVVLIVADIFKQ
jgi:quercetin dioxygenase-like cupin family protein